MVDWFWRSSNAKGERDSFSHLPPNVRAFLESEAPVKPSRNLPPAEAEIDSSEKPKFDAAAYAKHTKYAELYTTYKPLEMVDAEYRTPATAVTDVFKSYKDRQGYIARAALENCVFEQEALHLCYGSNKLGTLSGCSKESKTSETCYKSQQVCWLSSH